ncbi:DnaJ-related protein spj1 [Trametes pubescens]|uniref:DnaJ-related protein spj1 n=1 Tax=Trametes pubescens TaxID=154538 RepID=A0A1M2VV18_TRAPU|nr:DnaJ-related protein spj1 [Trametes pubescens]
MEAGNTTDEFKLHGAKKRPILARTLAAPNPVPGHLRPLPSLPLSLVGMGSPTLLLLVVLLAALLVHAADLYKVLDLHKSASEQDIRKAYKRLSRKYHPDKNKEDGAEEKFVEIAHAYEVLSDSTKRQIYDRHGEEGLRAHEGGQGHHANPFDMFQNFFGGHQAQQQVRRGPTSLSEFEVSLADVYTGASIDFMVKKRILCDHCRGTGAASSDDIHTCGACGGQGVRIVRQQIMPGMFTQSQVQCQECGGRGTVIGRKCPHCDGHKVMDHTQHYTLEVPKGAPEGHEIVFEGEADESPDWEAGDVVLRIRSKKERGGWRRKESGLYWKETISVEEALLGFERNLTHLDEHIVELKRTGVTQPGYVQTIKGEGMPLYQSSEYGDLYVEYNVVLPSEISAETKKCLLLAFHPDSEEGAHAKDEL